VFTRHYLEGVRRKAIRGKVWYSTLDRVERGILTLSSRTIDCVKSSVLGVILVKIIAKLRDALKSPFLKRAETYGASMVDKISKQAVEWGYTEARSWSMDFGFFRYIALLDFNKSWMVGL